VTKEEMISKFQCPGCVGGPAPETCDGYKLQETYGFWCAGHVLGTSINGSIKFALGLPRGFNRAPAQDNNLGTRNKIPVSLWLKGTAPVFDKYNVAVWVLKQNEFLFVRAYAPRVDRGHIHVIEHGSLDLVPGVLDVTPFSEDMD
jgi:hypothetical protein